MEEKVFLINWTWGQKRGEAAEGVCYRDEGETGGLDLRREGEEEGLQLAYLFLSAIL